MCVDIRLSRIVGYRYVCRYADSGDIIGCGNNGAASCEGWKGRRANGRRNEQPQWVEARGEISRDVLGG